MHAASGLSDRAIAVVVQWFFCKLLTCYLSDRGICMVVDVVFSGTHASHEMH